MENEYAKDMYIDDSALDVEWLEQPGLMMKYTELQAKARREVDRQKEALSVTRAVLDRKFRRSPENYKIDKVVNETVNSALITHPSYKKAMEDLIEAQYEYQMISGAVASVEQRKSALEGLGRLLAQNYFSGPSVPRDLSNETVRNSRQVRVDGKIKIKRKK